MKWIIEGYVGASDLKLGMSPAQAVPFAGVPFRIYEAPNGQVFETREPNEPDLTYENDRLIEISFTPDVDSVAYDGLKVFTRPPSEILNHVMMQETNMWQIFDMLVAYDLGLFMHGLHNDFDKPRIGTFVKGKWDYMRKDECAEPYVAPLNP